MMIGCLGGTDPYTHLLLHMDGGNGSTVYTDSSIYARAVTRYGNAVQSTAQIKFDVSSSYHDGVGDYLSISGIVIGAAAFCFEGWFFRSNSIHNDHFFSYGGSGAEIASGFLVGSNNTNFYVYAGGYQIAATTIAASGWHHIALVGNGGANGSRNLKLYLDGTQIGLTKTVDYNYSQTLLIGVDASGPTEGQQGYIDEVRISIGTERYTGNFTVPTAPFLT